MVVEIIAGVIIGIIIGIILIYAIMQSRLNNKVRVEASKMFEQQKDQLRGSLQSETRAELDKWKAEYEHEVQLRIEEARKESNDRQRSALKGKIGEQMAPLLPEFTEKYEPADARFIGSPIDYVIFKNYSTWPDGEKKPIEIVLLDVKTGKSNTSPVQNSIKDAITSSRIGFDVLKPNVDSNQQNV